MNYAYNAKRNCFGDVMWISAVVHGYGISLATWVPTVLE